MENGFDPIKIAIIVLVVVVQGVAAFRGWMKKREQQKQAEESRLGFPNRNAERTSEPASASDDDLIDWDPLGENQDEPDDEPEPPARRREPARNPADIVFPPIESEEPTPSPARSSLPSTPEPKPGAVFEHVPVRSPEPTWAGSGSGSTTAPAAISVANRTAALHRKADAPRSNNAFQGKLPGDVTLRSAMIAKMVLERPLSARRGFGRDPRG